MSGFFILNQDLSLQMSMKNLKRYQQDLIDNARLNLAQPIKYKFSGFIKKYYSSLKSVDVYSFVFSNRLG